MGSLEEQEEQETLTYSSFVVGFLDDNFPSSLSFRLSLIEQREPCLRKKAVSWQAIVLVLSH